MDTLSIPLSAAQPTPARPAGRVITRAGFGCYRIALGNDDHECALRQAVLSGINLIDTSANYADGASEELVGNVVQQLAEEKLIERNSLTIVTKVGYVQGTNYALAREREEMGMPFPEMTKCSKGLWHCIHPEFIEDQISRSLERLQTSSIDVLLLHNPEYFLSWAAKKGCRVGESMAEFYRRIEQAFRHLEKEVERGRIRAYGISSNTFPRPSTDPEFCSLETVWEIAHTVGTSGRFTTVQMPLNLLERGAATERNQSGNTQTVLEFAEAKGLTVLINRPLNAIVGSRLVRIADVPCVNKPDTEAIMSTVNELIQLENTFYVRFLPHFAVSEQDRAALIEYLAPGTILQRHWNTFGNYEHWTEARSQHFLPRMNAGLRAISQTKSDDLSVWIRQFKASASSLFSHITCYYADMARARSAAAIRTLGFVLGDDFRNMSLSQLAVNAVRSTQGISSVLVGMRRTMYVDDVLEGIRKPISLKLGREEWLKLAALDTILHPQVG